MWPPRCVVAIVCSLNAAYAEPDWGDGFAAYVCGLPSPEDPPSATESRAVDSLGSFVWCVVQEFVESDQVGLPASPKMLDTSYRQHIAQETP